MAGRVDPPHERVVLTQAERRALDLLELALRLVPDEPPPDAPASAAVRRMRRWWRAFLRRCDRLAFWLVAVGTVVMFTTLSLSLLAGIGGAVLTGLGAVGYLERIRR